MLRRLIPVVGLLTLVAVGLSLTAETAGARPQLFRNRQSFYEPVDYVTTTTQTMSVVESQPVLTTGQQQMVSEEEVYYPTRRAARRGRSVVRTVMVPASPVRSTTMGSQEKGYIAYYRPPTADAPAGTVLLNVRVPVNAQILFNGEKTKQTGSLRQFVSPELTAGKHFNYKIEARWTGPDGKEIRRIRNVMVHANETVEVNLLRPSSADLSPAAGGEL